MSRILVSLVSDQTIPNIEFIREMEEQVDRYLFISTKKMEDKGNRKWILDTVALDAEKLLDPVIVDEFSFEDIQDELSKAANDEDTYFVNLTGGTKLMSLAVYEFFKTISSEMYYLTGRGGKIKVHPGRKKITSPLKAQISLPDYLSAYGFKIKNQSTPLRTREATEEILHYFLHKFDKENDLPVLEELRGYRSKELKNLQSNQALTDFLARVGFLPNEVNSMSKYECRYLSGDWFEEYLYDFIKKHLDVPDSAIGLSLFADKNGTSNEFDVLLMRNNKIYLFECKTSIYMDMDEARTFIGETIYKSDSLRNKMGLFAQTTIVTLSNLDNPKLRKHLERADASRVKLIGKSAFLNNELFEELKKV